MLSTPTPLPSLLRLQSLRPDLFVNPTRPGRTLHIGLVNLMPLKEQTEEDYIRLLAPVDADIRLHLIRPATHISRSTPLSHLTRHYITIPQAISSLTLDGLIVTGAPVEKIPFEQVDYWDELCTLMDHARDSVPSTLYICWAALAALYHLHAIAKRVFTPKLSGVYPQRHILSPHPLTRGMSHSPSIPHSRFSASDERAIQASSELSVILSSDITGPSVIEGRPGREYYLTGHIEYPLERLDGEYRRDTTRGLQPHVPQGYYTDDNPGLSPRDTWTADAARLFANWIDMLQNSYSTNQHHTTT